MRLFSEHFLIKPLCTFELESFIDALKTGSEFELARLGAPNISRDFVVALEESILPAVKEHVNDYLLYTIWLVIDKSTTNLTGLFSFNQPLSDRRKLDLSLSMIDPSGDQTQIGEAMYVILEWLSERHHFNQIQFHNELDPNLSSIFEKNQFIAMPNNLYVKKSQ